MNYITEILAFNDFMLSNRLSTGQIALWYALMYINNKCGWVEWFTAANLTLELYTGLSREGIAKARNILKQKGLIDFQANGTKATAYHINTIAIQNLSTMPNSTQDSTETVHKIAPEQYRSSTQDSTILNKQNKTKQNETINTAAAREDDPVINVLKTYEQYIGIITPNAVEQIERYIADGMEPALIMALIEHAAEQGKRTWQYVRGAIKGNLGEGVKTLAAYKIKQAERAQNRPVPRAKQTQKSKFNNYDDTNGKDYENLEDRLLDQMLEEGKKDDENET